MFMVYTSISWLYYSAPKQVNKMFEIQAHSLYPQPATPTPTPYPELHPVHFIAAQQLYRPADIFCSKSILSFYLCLRMIQISVILHENALHWEFQLIHIPTIPRAYRAAEGGEGLCALDHT